MSARPGRPAARWVPGLQWDGLGWGPEGGLLTALCVCPLCCRPEEPRRYANLMYDRRVVRGSTYALPQLPWVSASGQGLEKLVGPTRVSPTPGFCLGTRAVWMLLTTHTPWLRECAKAPAPLIYVACYRGAQPFDGMGGAG